jgi:uncharacterized protein
MKERYWNSYMAGIALGALLFLSIYLTGNGLGASGGVQRMLAFFTDLLAPGHVDATPYWAKLAGADRQPLDNWLVIEVIGVVIGGMVSGLMHGRLKIETFKGPRISNKSRWLFAFIGGLLMGYGARLARGCTSGLALSGGSVLSVGAWVFMLSIFAAAYALAWFLKRLWL